MVEQIAEDVFWVGVVDWDLRSFHGHELSTHRGSTYNAYLILDDKNVLVDTVWDPFKERLIENISEVIDPSEIDIVVANHAETDHSGALGEVLRHSPDATVICSKMGEKSIRGHFHSDWNFQTVSTGDSIGIGDETLQFIGAPMLHWPDSMFTYLGEKKILMPNDAFGQHYASSFRFNDQVDQCELYQEALKYYVNILTPFSSQVTKKIDEVLELGLPVEMIAPSHGVIWREEPLQIVEKYRQWAAQQPEKRAVLLYDTMWGATRRMAEAFGDGLAENNIPFKLIDIAVSDLNDALVEVFRSGMIAVGSPTSNGEVLPTVSSLLTSLKALKFKNKCGFAFGSYGWSGEGVEKINQSLEEAGIKVEDEGLRCKWQPAAEDLKKCRAAGSEIGRNLKA